MSRLGRAPAIAVIALVIPLVCRTTFAATCPDNAHVLSTSNEGNNEIIRCQCDDGYIKREGKCVRKPQLQNPSNAQMYSEDSPENIRRLSQLAVDELSWFRYNNYLLLTQALDAALDPFGQQAPIEDVADEAKEHLTRYLELVRKIESLTSTPQAAQKRYAERRANFRAAKGTLGSITEKAANLKAELASEYPWDADGPARGGRRCVFDNHGRLLCE